MNAVVTVCDVLDAGACIDGVIEFVKRHAVIKVVPAEWPSEAWIQKAAGDGDGYGDGDGSGYGYGYGYGDGYGYGYGDGDGT